LAQALPVELVKVKSKKGIFTMKFSLVPMLLTGQSISAKARQALRENRLKDAAEVIMEQYGLNCVEVTHLLDFSMCEQ
jgi:hypothetical protein